MINYVEIKNMVSKDEYDEKIKEIISFAEIHGWCNQIDDMITGYFDNFLPGKSNSDSDELFRNLETRPDSLYETLILIVLLFKLGKDSKHLSELILPMLGGRIDLVDMQFCFSHFFGGESILPPDLTFDLTTRSFLSFNAAIARAMKIEKTMSKTSPENTVLYLLILLARMDLNKQNKVMIALLISRIDAGLPDRVKSDIYLYLENMLSIIENVSEQGDGILSESFNRLDEPSLPERKSEYPLSYQKNHTPDEDDNISQEGRTGDILNSRIDLEKTPRVDIRDNPKNGSTVSSPNQSWVESRGNMGNFKKPITEEAKQDQGEDLEKEQKGLAAGKIEDQREGLGIKKNKTDSQNHDTDRDKDGGPSQGSAYNGRDDWDFSKPDPTAQSSDPELFDSSQTGGSEKQRTSDDFEIQFNRTPDFLQELLEGINENQIRIEQALEPEEKPLMPAEPEPEKEQNIPENLKVKLKRRRRPLLLFLIPITLLLLLIFLLPGKEKNDKVLPVDKAFSEKLLESPTADIVTSGEKSIPEADVSIHSELETGSYVNENTGWSIYSSGENTYIWDVKKDQSFWKLYKSYFLQSMTWHEFLSKVQKSNPDFQGFHKIQPGDSFYIPSP